VTTQTRKLYPELQHAEDEIGLTRACIERSIDRDSLVAARHRVAAARLCIDRAQSILDTMIEEAGS